MYDALSKGIRLSNGDIFAYINAGDIYHHKAFEIIDKVFCDKKKIGSQDLNLYLMKIPKS